MININTGPIQLPWRLTRSITPRAWDQRGSNRHCWRRMQTNQNLLEEMRKIVRVTKPDLTILVVDALTGNDAVEQGKVFSQAVKMMG